MATKKKLSERQRRKELTGINLAALKKSIKVLKKAICLVDAKADFYGTVLGYQALRLNELEKQVFPKSKPSKASGKRGNSK